MTKGISVPTSFVPPVHTPSASEAFERSCAPWSKFLPATALVCTRIITDPPLVLDGADYISGCYASFLQRWSVSLRRKCSAWVFVIQNPARFPNRKPETRLDSGQRLQILLFLASGNMESVSLVERRIECHSEERIYICGHPLQQVVSNGLQLFLPHDEQYPLSSVRHRSKNPSSKL